MLFTSGVAKLGDFGVSRQMSAQTVCLNSFYGTPLYLSPELIQGQPYSQPTDVWSLGVMLYELLSLRHPFSGSGLQGIVAAVLRGVYPSLPRTRPPEFGSLVASMLAQEPRQRPRAEELVRRLGQLGRLPRPQTHAAARRHAAALAPAAAGRPTGVPPVPAAAPGAGSGSADRAASAEIRVVRVRRRRPSSAAPAPRQAPPTPRLGPGPLLLDPPASAASASAGEECGEGAAGPAAGPSVRDLRWEERRRARAAAAVAAAASLPDATAGREVPPSPSDPAARSEEAEPPQPTSPTSPGRGGAAGHPSAAPAEPIWPSSPRTPTAAPPYTSAERCGGDDCSEGGAAAAVPAGASAGAGRGGRGCDRPPRPVAAGAGGAPTVRAARAASAGRRRGAPLRGSGQYDIISGLWADDTSLLHRGPVLDVVALLPLLLLLFRVLSAHNHPARCPRAE
ncbi:unnamed protein product [Prorocentrum cordatum]|uniref:non-specific serine/threonine protein kinase n=1 Tax=Prorocentrum cordatum TaxID=2364126 RepID=A0ABN9V3U0_9DINO|nr:unnamed protein product [Polarella glacialis]